MSKDSVVKVLSAPNGPHEANSETQQLLCFLSDGRLLIVAKQRQHHHVDAYVELLRRKQVDFAIEEVESKVVSDFNSRELKAANVAVYTDMQKESKALFEDAVQSRASDIHIRLYEGLDTSEIWYRIHGDLEMVSRHNFDYGSTLRSTIYNAMTDDAASSLEDGIGMDANISDRAKLPNNLDGIRIATNPTNLMVLRLLYNDTTDSLDVEELGFSKPQSNVMRLQRKLPFGVNLVSGPTGAGKSTTLQRTIMAIAIENDFKKHIYTIEDPIEYPILGAMQNSVPHADNPEARLKNFMALLQNALRLDPDVLLFGEIRDKASASEAIAAGMTGHQVWASLHTNDAIGCLDRLIDLGVPKNLVYDASIITGLTCQKLVKQLCPCCKKPFSASQTPENTHDYDRIMGVITSIQNVYVRGDGCEECSGRGHNGRIAIVETLITDDTLMMHLKNGHRIAAVDHIRNNIGAENLLQSAIEKVTAGIVDPFDAEMVVGPLGMIVFRKDHVMTQAEVNHAV